MKITVTYKLKILTHDDSFQISHVRQIFADIAHIKVNNGRMPPILNLIELNLELISP